MCSTLVVKEFDFKLTMFSELFVISLQTISSHLSAIITGSRKLVEKPENLEELINLGVSRK